ncbi:MAG: hypothetical protein HQL46_07895 [Gammaproteobacteria bacterium]|nr:hypothetical protein [Gammaproteobacteria bacterium]
MSQSAINEIKGYLNQYVLNDIQLVEVASSQTKLSFYLPDNQYIETQVFNDDELDIVIDLILSSKSRLKLGC